jgi:hemerythrin-like domain-containing protein
MDDRREFLRQAGLGAALLLLSPPARAEKKEEEQEVSPTEDLMREHGVLRRILLIYGEAARRLEENGGLAAETIERATQIVRAFIEDYHERDEEEYIFPPLRKAGKLADLVNTLVAQHQAGRKLTAELQRLAPSVATLSTHKPMAIAMRRFIRMYEPHAAREDTVLFPAFVAITPPKEMKRLQELFEKKEHALPLGDFEKMVDEVAKLEKTLGIYELAQFTP